MDIQHGHNYGGEVVQWWRTWLWCSSPGSKPAYPQLTANSVSPSVGCHKDGTILCADLLRKQMYQKKHWTSTRKIAAWTCTSRMALTRAWTETFIGYHWTSTGCNFTKVYN
jgi:hypothetical protein